MTDMPPAATFEYSTKMKRHSVVVRLEVWTGSTWALVQVSYGDLQTRANLRKRLQKQLRRWAQCSYFGEAKLRVTEQRGQFIAL